jgi:CRISPR/Cas system endoribonuclease Cas6 (RAMP superfamily)
LSGFVGEVTYRGEFEPFLPLLLLGEYLHVGKNVAFGNGWYRIEKSGQQEEKS